MSIARSTARPVARSVAYGPASNKWGGGGLSIFVTDGRGEITVPAGAFTLTVNGQDYALNTADIIGQPPVFLEDAEIANDDADTSSSITEGDTLTATAGVFVYDPDGGEPVVTYAWVQSSSEIATGDTRIVSASDPYLGLDIREKATNSFGTGSRDAAVPVVIVYDADALAVFAAHASDPDTTHKNAIQTLIASLKSGAVSGSNIWAKLDALYVMATSDSTGAVANWKSPGTYNLTATNSPTFTADQGYTGNGTNAYLDTGFNPSTAGGQYAANSASIFAWNLSSTANNNGIAGLAGSWLTQLFATGSGSIFRVTLNDNTIYADITNVSKQGFYSGSRRASNDLESYKDGSSKTTNTTAATTSLPNANIVFLRANSGYSDAQLAIAGFGAGLTDNEQLDLYNAFAAYKTAIGF